MNRVSLIIALFGMLLILILLVTRLSAFTTAEKDALKQDSLQSTLATITPATAPVLPSIPVFSRPEFSSDDLVGKVSIVNFFASWCPPCEYEHPELIRLKNDYGITIYGVDYKDSDSGRLDYLQRLGNPYIAITSDPYGKFATLWLVRSVPETLVIDHEGRIRYRLRAPLTPEIVNTTLLPLIRSLQP